MGRVDKMTVKGRWMSTSKLRALYRAGVSYDDIAVINERSEGWKPSRTAVMRKRDALGEPARRVLHGDLLPWRIRPEHNQDRIRYMLQAESRRRAGVKQSRSDRVLTQLLNDLIYGRGRFMVVGYSTELGFYLAERKDSDTDIIRRPFDQNDSRNEVITSDAD
jgi:hypothetical protein